MENVIIVQVVQNLFQNYNFDALYISVCGIIQDLEYVIKTEISNGVSTPEHHTTEYHTVRQQHTTEQHTSEQITTQRNNKSDTGTFCTCISIIMATL